MLIELIHKSQSARVHLFYIPQCSSLYVALWDMEQVHSVICEIGLYEEQLGKHGNKH